MINTKTKYISYQNIWNEKVAMLHLDKIGVELTTLSKEQAEYIGVDKKGPFKSDQYRY